MSEDASAPPLRRDVRTARSAVPAAGAPTVRAGRLIAGFAAIALIGAGALVAGLATPDPEVRESRPVEKHDLTVASIGGEGVGGIVRPVDRDDAEPTVPPVAPAEPQPQPPSSPVVTEEQPPSPPPAPAPSPEPSHPGGNGDRGRGPGEHGRADPPPHAKPGSVLAFVERTAGYAVDLLGIDLRRATSCRSAADPCDRAGHPPILSGTGWAVTLDRGFSVDGPPSARGVRDVRVPDSRNDLVGATPSAGTGDAGGVDGSAVE